MEKFTPRTAWKPQVLSKAIALVLSLLIVPGAFAQEATNTMAQTTPAEYVSIHVDNGNMRQVLNTFAMQANRNIVLSPEVTNSTVTIHLNNVQWKNALDVILKPYGYGYREVGDTIVVGELSKLQTLETVEPLQSRIFELRYLDANDVNGIVEGMLSPRGSFNIITIEGQKGWKDLAGKVNRYGNPGSSSLEMRSRQDAQFRSKTIVVTDVPSILDSVGATLDRIDKMPRQVLVEARFMEVNEDVLTDIGAQFGIGGEGVGINQRMFNIEPSTFNPQSESLSGSGGAETPLLDGGPTALGTAQASAILDTGGQLFGVGRIGDIDMELYINLLEEDVDTKTLSAPKVVTLDNQEAAIVVGTRYPIIRSQYNTYSSNSSVEDSNNVKSETLEYYESIGIQLNVVPQICADGYIKMVVRPSVTEIIGERGINNYPIIKTRDTETQVLAYDGETIVIGGLLEERETTGQIKIPFLGDLPYIGRLFRRDTTDTRTIDLLIFLKATAIDEGNYDIILEETEEEVAEVIILDEATREAVMIIEGTEPALVVMEEEESPMNDADALPESTDMAMEETSEIMDAAEPPVNEADVAPEEMEAVMDEAEQAAVPEDMEESEIEEQ